MRSASNRRTRPSAGQLRPEANGFRAVKRPGSQEQTRRPLIIVSSAIFSCSGVRRICEAAFAPVASAPTIKT